MALNVLFKNKNSFLFLYLICILLNLQMCQIILADPVLQNPDCAAHYHDRQFSILAKARTQFHLEALEAIFIKT